MKHWNLDLEGRKTQLSRKVKASGGGKEEEGVVLSPNPVGTQRRKKCLSRRQKNPCLSRRQKNPCLSRRQKNPSSKREGKGKDGTGVGKT